MRLLFVSLLTACSEYQIDKTQAFEGPQGALEADPPRLSFAPLPFGEEEARSFSVHNIGEAAVQIDSFSVTGSGSFSLTLDDPSPLLAPGDEAEVWVTFSPNALAEEAVAVIESEVGSLTVPLDGGALAAAISLTPSPLSLVSLGGEAVTGEVIATSIGTAPLELSAALVQGEGFALGDFAPTTLDPGESLALPIRFTPPAEGEWEGDLWVSSNGTGSGNVPLEGLWEPACWGLAEAWDRGALDIRASSSFLILSNEDEDADICMEQWYLFLTDASQDAGAGDPGYDPGASYPEGTLSMSPGESLNFQYGDNSDLAWWCVEETQITANTTFTEFIGARVPSMLLRPMLDGDQNTVWQTMTDHPVMAVGHGTHYVEMGPGDAVSLQIIARNLGRKSAEAAISETIPAGFTASDWSLDPDRTVPGSGGETTYTWFLDFNAAIDTPIDTQTVYDEALIRYTLTREGDCVGRLTSTPPTAMWSDSDDVTQTSDGAPLVIFCAGD